MTVIEEFTGIFRAEHRGVRDVLLQLMDAFRERDAGRARSLVISVAAATGPHFRYEEEAMYPQLVDIFGDAYVERLLAEHDGAIHNTTELLDLAAHESLTAEQAARGVELTRQILPHVSDCDGLSLLVETLEDRQVDLILTARRTAREAGLDLLTWAGTERTRRL